jgi:hypothetical protein
MCEADRPKETHAQLLPLVNINERKKTLGAANKMEAG